MPASELAHRNFSSLAVVDFHRTNGLFVERLYEGLVRPAGARMPTNMRTVQNGDAFDGKALLIQIPEVFGFSAIV
jgi:hypothetical protein